MLMDLTIQELRGFRFYARLNNTNDPWFLLIDGNMEKGIRTKLSDSEFANFETPSAGAHATRARTNSAFSTGINLETYEIINGFSPDEDSISISGLQRRVQNSSYYKQKKFYC